MRLQLCVVVVVTLVCLTVVQATPEARACGLRDDCVSCVRQPECGWCESDNKCLPGTIEEPSQTGNTVSRCIKASALWHFEEGSCSSQPLRNKRRGPLQPDTLFDPSGPGIEVLIPQLKGIFPDLHKYIPPHKAHHKHHNSTLFDKHGRKLTPTQVKRVVLERHLKKFRGELQQAREKAKHNEKKLKEAEDALRELKRQQEKELADSISKQKYEAAKLKQQMERAARQAAETQLSLDKAKNTTRA